MAQHTQGPWEVNATKVSCMVVRGSQSIATVNHFNWDCAENARLIAAAPDLLDALRVLIADIDSATSLNDFIIGERATRLEEARAAIAKAQGGA